MTAPRITADDLELAAEWLDAYDGTKDGDTEQDATEVTMHAVAAWLRAEVARRRTEAQARAVVAQLEAETGRRVSLATAREAIQRQAARA